MTGDTAAATRGQRGYAMIALLVLMSVMAIALSTALPVAQTAARREREAELVFRGEQYARAIRLFQRKYVNALPPDVDVLLTERFLRKKYLDPITGKDFRLLGPGSPELAEAMAAAPVQTDSNGVRVEPSRGDAMGTATARTRQELEQTIDRARELQDGPAPGGIVAVASTSSQESLRLYNGKGHYNEWLFMALQSSVTGGAPVGAGALVPGGRTGGASPGGRGPDPRGAGPGPPASSRRP